MEQYDQLLKSLFLNKTLNDIEFFDHDLRYYSPNMDQTWIVDGGVQFQMDESYVSFAYAGELQFFNLFLSKAEEIPNDFEFKSLGARDVVGIESQIGKSVTDVKATWNFYEELNEDFEPTGVKKYMPFEILLTFDNQSFLQIAAVEYRIADNQIVDLVYNSERDMLISLNKKFEIGME
jgi:hypothetical protein